MSAPPVGAAAECLRHLNPRVAGSVVADDDGDGDGDDGNNGDEGNLHILGSSQHQGMKHSLEALQRNRIGPLEGFLDYGIPPVV